MNIKVFDDVRLLQKMTRDSILVAILILLNGHAGNIGIMHQLTSYVEVDQQTFIIIRFQVLLPAIWIPISLIALLLLN